MKSWEAFFSKSDGSIVSYEGPVNHTVISRISDEIEHKFDKVPRVRRKLFSIFIELSENILYYSPETNISGQKGRMGLIAIQETKNHYILVAGNYVRSSSIEGITKRCSYINSLDEKGLRRYRLALLARPLMGEGRGAGIGLIKVALTSGHPLDIGLKKINDQTSFLTIAAKVSK